MQFEELISTLNIPASDSPAAKLAKLRAASPKQLVDAATRMKHHDFRSVTDSLFIAPTTLSSLSTGAFAAQLKRRNVRLLMGECRDEHFLYGTWYPPDNSLDSLFARLQADYPLPACEALVRHYYPTGALPPGCKDWADAFGRVYADIQIHHLERGMASALARHGAGHLLYRYRIEWRAAFEHCVRAAAGR